MSAWYFSAFSVSFLGFFVAAEKAFNTKPDDLPHQLSPNPSISEPGVILSSSCIVRAATRHLEERVLEAQCSASDPGGGPANCLFLFWILPGQLSCSAGIPVDLPSWPHPNSMFPLPTPGGPP